MATEATTGTAGEGGNVSTGSTGTQGTSGAAGTTAGTPNQAGTQGAAGTGSTGATTGAQPPSGFTYKEDRTTWTPPHRLREETTKRTQLENELATARQQLQAITGATPPSAVAAKEKEVKEAFYALYPNAKRLLELDEKAVDRLLNTPNEVDSARQFVSQGWAKHGKTTLTNLVTNVAEQIGGTMSERAQGRLKSAFIQMIETESRKSDHEGQPTAIFQKYIDGDESLVQDFAKEWAEDYFVPARRQVASREVARVSRPVVNSSGRTQQTSVERPAKFNSLDERLDYAAKLAQERGMEFAK